MGIAVQLVEIGIRLLETLCQDPRRLGLIEEAVIPLGRRAVRIEKPQRFEDVDDQPVRTAPRKSRGISRKLIVKRGGACAVWIAEEDAVEVPRASQIRLRQCHVV